MNIKKTAQDAINHFTGYKTMTVCEVELVEISKVLLKTVLALEFILREATVTNSSGKPTPQLPVAIKEARDLLGRLK